MLSRRNHVFWKFRWVLGILIAIFLLWSWTSSRKPSSIIYNTIDAVKESQINFMEPESFKNENILESNTKVELDSGGKEKVESDAKNKNRSNPDVKQIPKSVENSDIYFEEILVGPLAQDDLRLIRYIKKNIIPPSKEAYNLERPNYDPSNGQSQIVKHIFQNKRGGFFVECGAYDGEWSSNTLSLEKEFGWKGLLIEADPSNFKKLLNRHRQAWAINVCLSVKPYPHQVNFNFARDTGEIAGDISTNISQEFKLKNNLGQVQCFPLFSILKALEIDIVDFFSLDVEGSELGILETIPFEKILIKVISIEYVRPGKGNIASTLTELLKKNGYRFAFRVNAILTEEGLSNDLIFAHKSVFINEDIINLLKNTDKTKYSNILN